MLTRYKQFKNAATWLTKIISAHNSGTEMFSDVVFSRAASNVNFNNEPNPGKVMTEFSKNYFKNLFWTTLFLHLRENFNFKNTFLPFSLILDEYHYAKFQRKLMKGFWGILVSNAQTYVRIGKHEIINRTNLGKILHNFEFVLVD